MKRTKLNRWILFVVLLLTVAGATFAYKEYNRKRTSAVDREEDYTEEVNSLSAEFATNTQKANEKYLNKLLSLQSIVDKVEQDEKGIFTIIFTDSTRHTSIRCLMDSTFNEQANRVRPATKIRVKGTCTGYNPDDMGLGADIILQRTVIYQP
jgi:hypothetical protein